MIPSSKAVAPSARTEYQSLQVGYYLLGVLFVALKDLKPGFQETL